MVNSVWSSSFSWLFVAERQLKLDSNYKNSKLMILEQIRQRAAADPQHIILPEGEDARTLQAAEICVRQKIAKITVIGMEEKMRELAVES
ncbi:MAG: phosphate acyltransferase, partial [Pyrinomonadaceae bacterium]